MKSLLNVATNGDSILTDSEDLERTLLAFFDFLKIISSAGGSKKLLLMFTLCVHSTQELIY